MKTTVLLAGNSIETGSVNANKLYGLLVEAANLGSKPSFRDLMNAMGFVSPAPLVCILKKFEERGFTKTVENLPAH